MADTRTDTGEGLPQQKPCQVCDGAGRFYGEECTSCEGRGSIDCNADLPPLAKPSPMGWHFGRGAGLFGYTAEQVRQAQREARAPLEVEIARLKNELQVALDAAARQNIAAAQVMRESAALRAQQPAPLQQPSVKPWRERSVGPDGYGLYPDAFACQEAEIADLRAELASRGAAQGRNTCEELSDGEIYAEVSRRADPDGYDAAVAELLAIAGRAAQALDMGNSQQSIETPAFIDLLYAWGAAESGEPALEAADKLISYIDAWAARRAVPDTKQEETNDRT